MGRTRPRGYASAAGPAILLPRLRARPKAEAFLTDHYAIEGSATAMQLAAGALTDKRMVEGTIAAYEQAGCDELLLFPCSPDCEQVRLLAEAVR